MAKKQYSSPRPRPKKPGSASPSNLTGVRIQRILAQAGHGSRRQCEELIVEGRVCVDGQVVSELGARVDIEKQRVEVDGTLVRAARSQYFLVNKPMGVLSTNFDPDGRTRVIDLINTDQRVYNVGRLDKSSEGLILVTNDGELANRLTHPRYGVQKTYLVTVVGRPKQSELELLKQGVRLAEGTARVTDVRIKKQKREYCELVIVLDEGRNREIRRLLARVGHKVTRLKRIAIGPVQLGTLPAGGWRRLELDEIESLRKASARTLPRKKPTMRPIGEGQFERDQASKRIALEQKKPSGRRLARSEKPESTSTDLSPSRVGKPPASKKRFEKSGKSASGSRAMKHERQSSFKSAKGKSAKGKPPGKKSNGGRRDSKGPSGKSN